MFLIFKTSKINLKKIKLQSKGDIKLLNKMSFQKKRQIINIKGTKPSIQNGQLLVSTGNPSLNHLIGNFLFYFDIKFSMNFKKCFCFRRRTSSGICYVN